MGFFTWTDCQSQKDVSCGYGRKLYLICPSGDVITESYYDGYGIFAGNDVYELVVDWNKEDLINIFEKMPDDHFGSSLKDLVKIYIEQGEEAANKYYMEILRKGDKHCLIDWKREVGITIACEDEDNAALRYPIKISKKLPKLPYSELKPSFSTQ